MSRAHAGAAQTIGMRRPSSKTPEGKRRYSVGGVITISVYTEVVASSPEEARALARGRGIMSLCHQCASADASAQWVTSGELDCDAPSPRDEDAELEVLEL